ncbi:site-specific integrase [Acidiphilium sp.]|uniref:tyrosine-type recombinase/integrase n=1 Tax=Acidiphilium sp. TaxID=527 RepID=UPI00258A3E62|nr:site-specific integrase [Acidiphilium sp.]
MATAKITAKLLEGIKPGDVFWDTEVRGFGVRCRTTPGEAYFIWKGRSPIDGKQIAITIGRHGRGDWPLDEARRKAAEYRNEVRLGRNPAAKPEAEAVSPMTVAELCDAYLAAVPDLLLARRRRAKKPSTISTDRSRIERHIKPLMGKMPVRDVTLADVETLMQRIASGASAAPLPPGVKGKPVSGGEGAASRTIGLLGAIFAFAVKRKLRSDNPVRGVVRYADVKKKRRLDPAEYRMLAIGIDRAAEQGMTPYATAAARFLAVSGWRRGEVLALTWNEVDASTRTARLKDSKTGESTRPLSHAALDILGTLPRMAGNPHCFPARSGEGIMSGFPKLFERLTALGGLPDDVTPHVLRHSFASVAAELGYSDAAIAGLLGHQGGTITRRYIHTSDAVQLQAADAVARAVLDLMGEGKPESSVVQMRR